MPGEASRNPLVARGGNSGASKNSRMETFAPRLLDRLRAAIRLKHDSIRTERVYVGWIRRFILFQGKRHPSEMGALEVTAFLTDSAVRRDFSASTQN